MLPEAANLSACGAAPSDAVRLRTYVVGSSPEHLPTIGAAIGAFVGDDAPPPNTLLGVASLAMLALPVEIEADALVAGRADGVPS